MALVGVDALLSALAELDGRFEERPQQRAMAEAVAAALASEENLVVEAGTGVGKSLGYLLPGALWAAANGRRLLVSTYTRALQEQILEKDLPVCARVLDRLGFPLRYAMLQGADNYLCVQRLARLEAQPELLDAPARLGELSRWSRTATTGHRSAIPFHVPQTLWSRVSRDPDLCLGPNGKFWGRCLYRQDRALAERSQIVVVNHALLLSGARLPPYDALVVDEAHNLEEAAVTHYGLSVSQGRFARLVEEARARAKLIAALAEPAAEVEQQARAFFAALAQAHGASAEEPGGRLLAAADAPAPPDALPLLEKAFAEAAAAQPDPEAETELRLLQGRAAALRSDLSWILGESSDDVARWVEWSSGGALELRAAPLEVAERLEQGLFARNIPVVLTSATLSTGRGLSAFKRAVGLEGARELALDSPFDYATQAGLLLCGDLPEPSDDKEYVAALTRRCEEIVARVPGGLFILFSSWRTLRAAHERLRKKIKGRPLWIQGSAGSDALLSDFAEAGNAVLLGVETFWQGVDVPGAALSCVVLVKLPFPNFGSPVEQARRKWFESLGRGYFEDHSLPRAVQKFRQGFGRLIRSSTDKGAVVVLDPRVAKRGYGQAFLEALPRCRRLETLEELGVFFSAEAPRA